MVEPSKKSETLENVTATLKKVPEVLIGKYILSTVIIVLFVMFIYILKALRNYHHIKNNLDDYKCKPNYMPFMGFFGLDVDQNREKCTQNAQAGHIKDAQTSINKKHKTLSQKTKELGDNHDHIKSAISNTNSNMSSMSLGMSGLIDNTVLNFKKTFYTVSSLTKKIMLNLKILTNVAATGLKTGESIVNGPILKTLKKMCFHPDTIVTLQNKQEVTIKNAKIGDYLENGSRINGKVDVENIHSDFFYKIKNKNKDILVTGSHKIFDETTKRFIEVKDSVIAERTTLTLPTLHCLITDDHVIKIGEHVFWDWED